MSQKLSSAVVVSGALRVNFRTHLRGSNYFIEVISPIRDYVFCDFHNVCTFQKISGRSHTNSPLFFNQEGHDKS